MNQTIDKITEFLFDENRRLSSKAAVVVFTIIALLIIDNVLGFSYYYNTDKKVEQIQKLNIIIKDPTLDNTTKTFALHLRSEIIDRQNVLNQIFYFSINFKWFRFKQNPINSSKEIDNTSESIVKNNFWFHITAGGFYYLIAISMLPGIVFFDKKTSLTQRIATGIFATILFFGLGLFFYWLFNFIPQVSSSTWIWNYLLNLILQFLLIALLIQTAKKKN